MAPIFLDRYDRAEYDNSRFYEANLDPSATVQWGAQPKSEILAGAFTFSWDDEVMQLKPEVALF